MRYVNLSKTVLRLVVLLLTLVLSSTSFSEEWFRVRWVDDGDTIVLSSGEKVRYLGINAPEIPHEDQAGEIFGWEARNFNKRLVYHKKIRLEFDQVRRDRYMRLLAYVFLKDGTFVNAEMIRQGYAYVLYVRPNTKFFKFFLKLQQSAIKRRVGLWSKIKDQKYLFIGNRRSRRFHSRTCPFGNKIGPRNRILFKSLFDAFRNGYTPCKRCNPWQYDIR